MDWEAEIETDIDIIFKSPVVGLLLYKKVGHIWDKITFKIMAIFYNELFYIVTGRKAGIWTPDPSVPNAVLYQAEPLPETKVYL